MEDLSSASLDDVRAFFSTWYVPNNAVLTLVGDVAPDAALAMIERHFGPISAGDSLPPQPVPAPVPVAPGASRAEVVEPVPSGRSLVAYRIPPFGTRPFVVAEVLADLIANGRASRLHDDLVRRRQLAAEVSAAAFRFAAGEALVVVDVTAHAGIDTGLIEEGIETAVAAISRDGPREDELDRVRNLLHTELARDMERAGERADLIATHACVLGDAEGANRELSSYVAVDAEAVRDVASRYLVPGRQSVLTFVPES
jgi:predicted Zn-dependent peptidase